MAPRWLLAVPAAQASQAVPPERSIQRPGAQASQALRPSPEALPGAHGWHACCSLAPSSALKRPAGQLLQLLLNASCAKRPEAHSAHSSDVSFGA